MLSNKFMEKWNVFLILICQGKHFLIAEKLYETLISTIEKQHLIQKHYLFHHHLLLRTYFLSTFYNFGNTTFKWNSWQTVFLYRIDFHSYFDTPRSPKKRISREGRIGFGKHKKRKLNAQALEPIDQEAKILIKVKKGERIHQ